MKYVHRDLAARNCLGKQTEMICNHETVTLHYITENICDVVRSWYWFVYQDSGLWFGSGSAQ